MCVPVTGNTPLTAAPIVPALVVPSPQSIVAAYRDSTSGPPASVNVATVIVPVDVPLVAVSGATPLGTIGTFETTTTMV